MSPPVAPPDSARTPIVDGARAAQPSPTLDGQFPIALLPLRIETRFSGNQLKVRIFPDEIFADTHEPGLTTDEARDGAAYVATIKSASETAQWDALVKRYGAPRAAWIALVSAQGSPATRAESWTRAAQAVLPESWIVRAYRGSDVFTATVAAVRQPLALTIAPNPGAQVTISDGLTVDADIEWTLHYDAAVAAGMAVTIDLTRPDGAPVVTRPPIAVTPPIAAQPVARERVATSPAAGSEIAIDPGKVSTTNPTAPAPAIDVVAIGLKNQSAADGAAQLRALLDAQHYTRGIAFVAPGTPTSNTADATAGYPVADPGGAQSFAVERQAPTLAPGDGSDGDRFARALGLVAAAGEKVAAVEHVAGAARAQESSAAAMNGALWPATLGYFMQQMMAPKFDAATIEQARQYFVGSVRPGGPLPSFRVGAVPYGLLPVVSLTRYAPDALLPHALRTLRDDHFLPAATKMPRVTAGSADPDGDLLQALAVDASCRQTRIRVLLGEDVTTNIGGIFGLPAITALGILQAARAAAASALLGSVGLGADTRMGHVDPGVAAQLLNAPLVTSAPLSETIGVSYIQTLHDWASASPPDLASLRDDKLPGTERPLLYRVLRHALLVEMDRVSTLTPLAATEAASAHTVERVAIAPIDVAEPELVNLDATANPTTTAYGRIGGVLTINWFAAQLAPYLAYLKTLGSLPSAELDRRFGETLDACSHRLEAWITSLANARLWQMRAAQPTGCHFGAFGWVQNVQPATANVASAGGYVHAPSAAQAGAAAILRNGYLSRGDGGSPYAVELSSARVRDALTLIDGTRQGETLAQLLGYRFERALHDYQLDKLIVQLRAQFPLVAGKTPAGVGPVELVAAGNVVDGLALRAAQPAPPASLTADEAKNFTLALAQLDDAVDGLADVLTAESVFQAVRGNPSRAVAGLDAMAQGVLPPEVDVVRTPQGGALFTQRLAVVLDGTTAAPANATPRSAAEPFVDAWVSRLLGDLSQVGCHVIAGDGTITSVTMAALALGPLDLVALAKAPPSAYGDGELDRRVLDAAGATAGATVQYDATSVTHSFAEWLELLRAIAALLGGARALLPADLVAAPDGPTAPITDAIAQAAFSRAQTALSAMAKLTARVSSALATVTAQSSAPAAAALTTLRETLRAAALYGVAGAYPPAGADGNQLTALATAAIAELTARQASAPALTATDATTLLSAATATMRALFGKDFLFAPVINASAPATLAAALAEAPSLIADANLPRQVLQQAARVRPGVGRWRSLFLYAEALGTLSPSIDVAQLPAQQATWAAAKGAAPADGTVSLLLHRPTEIAPASSCAGLIVDEWNELIPAATQSTAVAFRHETPVAEAPQAVLLAVPPIAGAAWDQETIFATVREALMLAQARLVDTIDDLRPFLPAVCLTGNTANETVSTNFLSSLIADPVILRSS